MTKLPHFYTHFLYKFYVTVCYTNDCRCSTVLLMMGIVNARNM
jgi:hypothetical protein